MGTSEQQRRPPLLQLVAFAGVGGLLNVLYGGLYLLLREVWDAQPANATALVLSTVVGTVAHRRFSFGVQERAHTVRLQLLGLALLGFSLLVTAGSLAVLEAGAGDPSVLAEVIVLVTANLGCGLVRFATLRAAVLPRWLRRDVRQRRAAAS